MIDRKDVAEALRRMVDTGIETAEGLEGLHLLTDEINRRFASREFATKTPAQVLEKMREMCQETKEMGQEAMIIRIANEHGYGSLAWIAEEHGGMALVTLVNKYGSDNLVKMSVDELKFLLSRVGSRR
jgi:hypothetical protein